MGMDRMKDFLNDPTSPYKEAVAELEGRNLRDAAEKSWGVSLKRLCKLQ